MEVLITGIVLAITGAVALLLGIFGLVFVFRYAPTWIKALTSGVTIWPWTLLFMDLRGVSSTEVVEALIQATQAGIDISRNNLEAHYLSGGNIINLTTALIEADKADIELSFEQAAAIDLAGRDVFDAVKISINPRVIDCPSPNVEKETVEAIAQDGIQIKAKARVTVRANLQRLVGGATEETIISRVGEGIVSAIGAAENHNKVLENPNLITQQVLEKGLDQGTAFEILSIDIADIDVGDNIGSLLQADQAEADKKIAQAEAEERRAMAVAEEQEMKAKVKENEAEVVKAEADVYNSLADAFERGKVNS
ncbi:MAG: flotillin-like protein FloA [bacterium]